MREELLRYRALAITLIATLVLGVGTFTHALRGELALAEEALDERVVGLAAETETHLTRLFERLESLGRARSLLGADEAGLVRLLRASGLDAALESLCVREGATVRTVYETPSGTGTGPASERCAGELALATVPGAGASSALGVRIDATGSGARGRLLDIGLPVGPDRELRATVSSASLLEPLARGVAMLNAPVSAVCLSLMIGTAFESIACDRSPEGVGPDGSPDARGNGSDRTAWLDTAGLSWRLTVRPDHRRLVADGVALPFALLGAVLATGAAACALVRSAIGRRLQLEAHAAELRGLVDRLESHNRSLDQFAAMAAHDLQAPMRFIVANSHLLVAELEELGREDLSRMGETLVSQGERMRELVLDLLEFCRAGQSALEVDHVDVGPLVEEEIALLRARQEFASTRIDVGALPRDLPCDRAKVVQIVRNLLGNAVKFSQSRPDPSVSIRAALDGPGDRWCFRVEDNGPGVSEEHRDRIFLPFKRLDETAEGTGIGLAIVRKLVERHGGRVWIDPDVRAGSAFCFTLPATNLPECP